MTVYRASELGGCVKMLVAKRLGMKPHETPPASMQKIFDRGHRHETACLATMADDKWEITSQQREVVLDISPDVQVVGHLDAVGYHPIESPIHRIIEAKSPQAWRSFIDEMYNPEPSAMIQRYKWQISAYMLAEDREALLTCLDEQFQLRYHGLEMPFYSLDDIKERVGMLEELAAEGYAGLPKFCNPREYPCQYFHLHEDEKADFNVDSELDDAASRYTRARDKVQAAQKVQDEARQYLMDVMGTRRKVQTENAVVSLYNRRTQGYDYAKMKLDGIDIEAYKTETVSKDIPRVTMKGSTDEST